MGPLIMLTNFEGKREEDDTQGKAGGLGDVEEAEDTGALNGIWG